MPDGIATTTSTPSLWVDGRGILMLLVDGGIFSTDAILRAAYKFTGACHVWIEQASVPGRYLVCLRPKRQEIDPAMLTGDFSNELIDQQLRARLEQQFGELRTIIAAQAFSEGNLLEPDRERR